MSAFQTFRERVQELDRLRVSSKEFGPREKRAITDLVTAVIQSDGVMQSLRLAFAAAYKALGAPGDFGYGTPEGKALQRLYQAWNDALKEAAAEPTASPSFDPIALGM